MTILLSGCIFLTVIALFSFARNTLTGTPHDVAERINRKLEGRNRTKNTKTVQLERREQLSGMPFLNGLLHFFHPIKHLQIFIKQADVPYTAGTFLLITLFTGFLISLWAIIFRLSTPVIIAAFFGSALFPFLQLKMRRSKRMKLFSKGFPDAIARLATSLRAGYSMQMAIESLINDSDSLIAKEFGILLAQMDVGQSFESALQNMLERIDTDDLRLFIASVSIQRESGGNLAELLDNLEFTIRERIALHKELESATGQAKLSGIVLSLLPVFVGLFVFFIHQEYIMFFFNDPVGTKLLACSVVGQLFGMLTIKKIVTIQM